MKLLFTKSNAPLSVLIRWALKEPCSHFVAEFDNRLMIHSNLLGVHLKWAPHFRKSATVVYEFEFRQSLEDEEQVYLSLINLTEGKPYDFGAFAYFAWRAFLWRFFGKEMPKRNPWGNKDHFLCTEIAAALPGWMLPIEKDPEVLGMMSPYKIAAVLAHVRGVKLD
jgi:hypothetical protein